LNFGMGSKKHGFFRVCGHRPRPLLGQNFNMAKGVFKRVLARCSCFPPRELNKIQRESMGGWEEASSETRLPPNPPFLVSDETSTRPPIFGPQQIFIRDSCGRSMTLQVIATTNKTTKKTATETTTKVLRYTSHKLFLAG